MEEREEVELKTTLAFDDQVIKKIAGLAVSKIPGILGLSGSTLTNLTDRFTNSSSITKGISTEFDKKQVSIDLDVIGEYGKSISEVFDNATKEVIQDLKKMTGLEVIGFNMHVSDIMTRKEYEEKFLNKKKENQANEN